VAASALNAAGKVAAAAFGLVVFNGVLVAAVLALIISNAQATFGTAAVLSAAMAVAGIAQLLCVGAAWRRLETHPRRLSLALSPAVRRFFVPTIPRAAARGPPPPHPMGRPPGAAPSAARGAWRFLPTPL